MRPMCNTDRRREAGQTFVLIAAVLPALLLAAALAIDVARMIAVRDELRVAVDSASLAGTRALYDASPTETKVRTSSQQVAGGDKVYGTGGGSTGRAVALNVNATNASSGDIVLGTWDFDAKTFTAATPPIDVTAINAVQVTARLSSAAALLPLTLGRLAGVTTFDTTLRATGVLGGPSTRRPDFPMVVAASLFQGSPKSLSTPVPFTMSPGGSNAAWTGFFSGDSASTIQGYIANPSTVPTIKRSDVLGTTNGIVAAAYHEAKQDYPPGSLFTVPVVTFDSGVAFGRVLGFATFSVVQIIDTASNKAIIGTLIGTTTRTGGDTLTDCFGLDCRALLVG